MQNKKAQEEMIGFVMIMLVVAVIFLVFLGIFVRQHRTTATTRSVEVTQFLGSIAEFTTDCTLDNGFSYKKIGSLAKECDKNALCGSGDTACETLNRILSEIIQSGWSFGSESRTTGYNFTVSFPSADNLEISEMPNGGCRTVRGADKPIAGDITFAMSLCLD